MINIIIKWLKVMINQFRRMGAVINYYTYDIHNIDWWWLLDAFPMMRLELVLLTQCQGCEGCEEECLRVFLERGKFHPAKELLDKRQIRRIEYFWETLVLRTVTFPLTPQNFPETWRIMSSNFHRKSSTILLWRKDSTVYIKYHKII